MTISGLVDFAVLEMRSPLIRIRSHLTHFTQFRELLRFRLLRASLLFLNLISITVFKHYTHDSSRNWNRSAKTKIPRSKQRECSLERALFPAFSFEHMLGYGTVLYRIRVVAKSVWLLQI